MREPFIDPLQTPPDVARDLAARLRALRLARNWKRDTLAARAGISPSSLKRFEQTGRISLDRFLKLCDALGRLGDMGRVLLPPPARSMKELEQAAEERAPKRGRL